MSDKIKISVRDLIEFILRHGSLDRRGKSGAAENMAMLEGARLHRKIQSMQSTAYSSEVTLSYTRQYEELEIVVFGRADGIIRNGTDLIIDEIKCVYKDVEDIEEPELLHIAQAKCYAFMVLEKQGEKRDITLQITYCNIETEEIKRLSEVHTYEEIKNWFFDLVDKYYIWVQMDIKHHKKMIESVKNIKFPFAYRKGQRALAANVYKAIDKGIDLFAQAPTGVGKTMAMIFPAVISMGEEKVKKLFYLTAKTITRTVASEGFSILRDNGLIFKTEVITAKEKICVQDEVNCNPNSCPLADGHFDRVNEALFEMVKNEYVISREVIEKYSKEYQVCPYELSLDAAEWMDGIICDYNYVYDPDVALSRLKGKSGKNSDIYLVDEAHNLVDRAREMYSASIRKEDIIDVIALIEKEYGKKSKKSIGDYPHIEKLLKALKSADEQMYKLRVDSAESDITYFDSVGNLYMSLLKVQGCFESYYSENEEHRENGKEDRGYKKGEAEKADDDSKADDEDNTYNEKMLDLYFKVIKFIKIHEMLDSNYQIYGSFDYYDNFSIYLYCINPSENLMELSENAKSTVFFSATLLPVNHYKELLTGNIEDVAIYIESPFDKKNRVIVCDRTVTSKYTRRGSGEYKKIYKAIKDIVSLKQGNYMVFFPSYKMLNDIKEVMIEDCFDMDVKILEQSSGMSEREKEAFLDEFNNSADDKTKVGLCVLGGVFSEGIDLKEESLIGCIIVGTGIPQIGNERNVIKDYYDGRGRSGFEFSYRYPGMNKVLQAAGRVIRTENDKGVIALLDERFSQWQYREIMPREWDDVYFGNTAEITNKVKEFWDNSK